MKTTVALNRHKIKIGHVARLFGCSTFTDVSATTTSARSWNDFSWQILTNPVGALFLMKDPQHRPTRARETLPPHELVHSLLPPGPGTLHARANAFTTTPLLLAFAQTCIHPGNVRMYGFGA